MEFDSRSESFKINSVQILLLAIESLDFLKRLGKIFPKRLWKKEIKQPGSNITLG